MEDVNDFLEYFRRLDNEEYENNKKVLDRIIKSCNEELEEDKTERP